MNTGIVEFKGVFPAAATAAMDVAGLLGAAIRERRTFLRISQEELAVRSGLHRTYLSDVERGARNPSIKTIEEIAQALAKVSA